MAMRMNGCHAEAQFVQDGPFMLLATVTARNDEITVYRLKK
jgi:hypothetical protein